MNVPFLKLFPSRNSERCRRLSWLPVFGLVAGVLELWADRVHVVYFHSLVYELFSVFDFSPHPPICLLVGG